MDGMRQQIERGGTTVRGARLGILMLETRFPRVLGDIGNAGTWPFPVLYKVVRGASVRRVTQEKAAGLLDAFAAAAQELVADGAEGITTSCGFLSLFQQPLAARCGVPVAVSSLIQIPFVERLLPPGKRAGVLTFSSDSLTSEHFEAVGVRPDLRVAGVRRNSQFFTVILNGGLEADPAVLRDDVLEAADRLVEGAPEIGAIVLECTNMAPYAADIRRRTGLPVFDIYNFITWFHASLAPREFGREDGRW
jgi:Asp/Glu/hydantoin racemase